MQPTEPNPTQILPPHLYRRALNALRLVLPPPLIGDPYDTTERDTEAMGDIAAMRPANGDEAALAVQVVATNALAMDIMAVVTESPVDAQKHWAASANMFRQARGARALLLRVQADRMKKEQIAATIARASGSETQSQITDNETDVRRDSPLSPDMVPWDRPRPKPFLPDPEIIAQLVADEALMKRLTTPSKIRPGRHSTSPARTAPSREMISLLTNNETDVRRNTPAPYVGPDSAPSGQAVSRSGTISRSSGIETDMRRDSVPSDSLPPQSVSCDETSSQLSGDETTMRQRILASSTHTPPDMMRARSALAPSAAAPPFSSQPPHQGPYAASPFHPGSAMS
jgi:hypothetical protein